MSESLIALAADQSHTIFERAAALNVAARLNGGPDPSWPDPPNGWLWESGELIRVAASRLPALRGQPPIRVAAEGDNDRPAQPLPPPRPRPQTMRSKAPDPNSGAGIVVELVCRPDGATLTELTEVSGLSVQSIRGVISIYARSIVKFDRRIGRYVSVEAP